MLDAIPVLFEIPEVLVCLLFLTEAWLKSSPVRITDYDFVVIHYVAETQFIETTPLQSCFSGMSAIMLL